MTRSLTVHRRRDQGVVEARHTEAVRKDLLSGLLSVGQRFVE